MAIRSGALSTGRSLGLLLMGLAAVWLFVGDPGRTDVGSVTVEGGMGEGIEVEKASSASETERVEGTLVDASPCTEEQARFQEKYFSFFADMGRRLGCVADKWEELIAGAMPDARVFIDIGMNKGYSSANFFALWAPKSQFTPQSVHKILKAEFEKKTDNNKRMSDVSCGACHDCTQVYQVPSAVKEHEVTVFGFEPGLNNFRLCQKVRSEYMPIKAHWIQERAAVADKSGTATFPVDSDETGAIGGAGVLTNITTVDSILEKHKLSRVDMLKIDTEGFDPLVLAGAGNSFTNHRIAVTLFEYHKLNKWWEISLESVVEKLDKAGYTCFLAGKDHVLRLTNCWRPMMEFKWWSNVICASRKIALPVVDVLDKRSFRTAGFKEHNGDIPKERLEKGYFSRYVYGAPPFDSLPQNTRQEQKGFDWV